MKQKDIALILVIVFISAVVSFLLSNSLITSPKNKKFISVVQPITSGFIQPDPHYFNTSAFDPTQTINIGQYNNTNPFSSTAPQ